MILYHFPTSPFARRVRLALAHKGLAVELRDARANPEHLEEVRRLNPIHTVPVLVDRDRAIADSSAICQYLERKTPDPPLFTDAEMFEVIALADTTITVLVDLGLRYHALHDHPSFPSVRAEYVGRAQRAIDRLAERMPARGDAWQFQDMVAYTLVAWLEALPARAEIFPPARQVLGLGWKVPPSLSSWAARHRNRPDVVALG
ncbi:MAG: glutathione S-transferase family protein [Polyangiales bacterium]